VLDLRQAPAIAIVEQKTSFGTQGVLAEVALGSSSRFAAFDDLVTLTVRAADGDERHGPFLPKGDYEDKAQCDSNPSLSPLLKHYHYVNHTQKEYARGDVHENRAECLFSLLKPYLRVFRGVSKFNLPGYVGFFQFLRNFRQQNAFEQAGLILRAALDPTIARKARKGEFVKYLDHFDLLQSAIN
jgi:hypothetical protein